MWHAATHNIVSQSLRLEGVAVSKPMKAELLQLNQLRAELLVTFKQTRKILEGGAKKEKKETMNILTTDIHQ